jgi:hypothetical protein
MMDESVPENEERNKTGVGHELDAGKQRLGTRFTESGDLSEEEVDETIERAAERFEDAPIQVFTPLLAEHAARDELMELELSRERQSDTASTLDDR